MKKNVKILSSVICGLVLSSSLALTNVQAKSVDNITASKTSTKSIILNQKFNYYTSLNGAMLIGLSQYFVATNNCPTVDGIRDTLVKNGLSRSIANNISFSLYSLATEYKEKAFPEDNFYSAAILQAGDGMFNMIIADTGDTRSYSLYGILTYDDAVKIRNHVRTKPSSAQYPDYTVNFLLSTGIINNKEDAELLSRCIWDLDNRWEYFPGQNKNLLLLKSDDGKCIKIARSAR
ncbi:hypothetical protein HBE96_25255 [Clostridium sp. P21]|uniref:Uncharacterized protein n=1 Tax=Clostridium muellerianum TaxID=2716538 RepID=A0A7Y0ELW8_9CLOT|nr:hypothetical protein [Clostridium muellerianum]NMM65889.1 hypothetical protein [Clostridium muellerianum]